MSDEFVKPEDLLKYGKVKKVSVNVEKGTYHISGSFKDKCENTSETTKDTRQLLTE